MPDRRLQRRGDHARQAVRLGDPQRGPHAAQRLHLEDDDVAGLAQVDPQRVGRPAHHLVGGDPDVDPAAQRDQLRQRGARLLDVLQPNRSSSRMRATAVSTSQAALASTRIAPAGPRASRTASTRARSSAGRLPGLGDLHLRGPAARRRTIAWARAASTAGTVTLTGTDVAHRRRPALDGGLIGGGPPAAALRDVVVPERGELAPAGRAADQDAVADVDAAEAGAQRHAVDPRLRAPARRLRQGQGSRRTA